MEHQNQHCLARFKDKLVDNADLLMFVFFIVFTMFSFVQLKSMYIWLPIFVTTLACFFLRVIRVSIYQYNYRKVVLLVHLFIYYFVFLLLQNFLRTKTPAREKENELLVVVIYTVMWFIMGTCLDLIGNRFWWVVVTVCTWISTTITMVLVILCFEGILPGENCGYSD